MDRIRIKCPSCGSRVVDANMSTKTEVIEESKVNENWNPDYCIKCHQCKKLILIKKVG